MKRILCIGLFLLISKILFAPNEKVIYIELKNGINIYEPLMEAIFEVESSKNINAYNPHEQATGGLQIRPIRLRDYNNRTGKHYTMKDMFNFDISKAIFMYYTKGRSFEEVAKSWNGSGPKTIIYWNKVKNRL
jgi:hypothetical protein